MNSFRLSPRFWPLPLAFFYLVGAAAHAVEPLRAFMILLTPWFLLVSGAVMIVAHARQNVGQPLWRWFIPVFLVTFALEVVGVATGGIFGSYYYTPVLGLGLADVPVIIGLNWVVVVLGAQALVQRWKTPAAVKILAVAALCVAFDLALEPVAIHLGYWVWSSPQVPLQNYLAWGTISGAAAWAGSAVFRERLPLTLGWYFLLQAGFFLILNVWILLRWIP